MSKFGASTLRKDLYDGLVVLGDEKLHLRIVTSPLEEALDRVESMRAKVEGTDVSKSCSHLLVCIIASSIFQQSLIEMKLAR